TCSIKAHVRSFLRRRSMRPTSATMQKVGAMHCDERARANPGNAQSRPYFAIAFAMKVGRFDFPADMIGEVSIRTRACRTAATGDRRQGRSLEKTIHASARNTPRARD